MNLSRLLQSIRRRWYLALAGLLATAALCAAAFLTIGPSYQRSASELLIPGSLSIPEGGNPYLYLGGLTQASDVLIRAINADDIQDPIRAAHPGSSVTITRDVTTSGPMILITVSGDTAAGVGDALRLAVNEVPSTMKALQDKANISDSARITVIPLTVDARSTVVQKSRFTAVGAIGAAGLALTLLVVGLVDGLLLSLFERRANRARANPGRNARGPSLADKGELPAGAGTAVRLTAGAMNPKSGPTEAW